MPPRRSSSGRHRKYKNTGGPAYVTAATLAAFAVSGMNVPDAIADAREAALAASSAKIPVASSSATTQRVGISAVTLRNSLAQQQEERASRLRRFREEAIRLTQQATKDAERAAEAARPKWVAPLEGYRLTAGFGDYGLWSSAHTGQDFAAPSGTAVRAVGDGIIVSTGYDGAYGNKIVVQHEDGTLTWYCHLSAILRTSGPVKAGDPIGRVGSTGNSTGNHLHLEVRPSPDSPVPPLTWLRQHGVEV
ncbi:MAG: M23 family metallopeptidase [Spirochaetaceae bacterium]|nr:M23 family metallopeptidase [Spirochaetaceae bacterium]